MENSQEESLPIPPEDAQPVERADDITEAPAPTRTPAAPEAIQSLRAASTKARAVSGAAWARATSVAQKLRSDPRWEKFAIRDDMSVRSSLRLGFACVLTGALVIGIFSLFQMGRLNGSTQAIYEQEYVAGQAVEQARSLVYRASRAQKALLTASTADERVALGKEVEDSLADIAQRMDILQKLSNTPRSQELGKNLQDAIASWTQRQRGFIAMVKAQPLELLEMSWEVPLEDAGLLNDTRKLEKIVDALVQQRGESAQATMGDASHIYRTSLFWVIGITVVLGALVLGISRWITRRIARQLGGEPAYAKEIARRIASGELSMQIELAPNDKESLLHALHEMQKQLGQTISEIAGSSKLVANASREISMGNLDLSNRTEQQAASLEKTTSNVEQMTAIAKRYADNATHAAQLSGTASKAATQGGEVVANVVLTMDKIRQTTQAIHSNIGRIQSIAFRTNILALNAAVEAAHAGEQGRGFAVVAAEVRDLAQRSAAAAKEINTLIESSSQQVQEGSRLVHTAGQTLADMARTVQKVSTVMEEISGASIEQSAGIEEINRAIAQLEETTQQNSALVEEGAAAAQSLDEQAQSLDLLVGRFSI